MQPGQTSQSRSGCRCVHGPGGGGGPPPPPPALWSMLAAKPLPCCRSLGAAAIGQGPPACSARHTHPPLISCPFHNLFLTHLLPAPALACTPFTSACSRPLPCLPACLRCAVSFAVSMARRRKAEEIEPADLLLHLERTW